MHFKISKVGPVLALAAVLGLGMQTTAHARDKGHGVHTVSATYYAKKYQGRKTASGERYDPKALTAAHPSLPLGSHAEIKRLSNGRSVVVRINDRNASHAGIDLSEAAARKLGLLAAGRGDVLVTPLQQVAEAP